MSEPSPEASGRGESSPVQAVDRALQIMEMIADDGASTVTSLATRLGVHRSTAFRLLVTLERRRFVEHRADGTYALGSGALRVAGAVTHRSDLAREAQQICDEVTAQTGETSNVAVLVDGVAINIAQTTGISSVSVRHQFVGQRTPLHATSSGKILLAHSGPELLAEACRHLERFTDTTITSPQALAAELEEIRARGWAGAVAEWQEATHAVAVPVYASDGAVLAALSLTAPAFRMPQDDLEAIAVTLREQGDLLAKRLGQLKPR